MRVLNQDGDSVEIREEDILYFSILKINLSCNKKTIANKPGESLF